MSHLLFIGIERFCHSHLFQHHSLVDIHLGPYKGEKKKKVCERYKENYFLKNYCTIRLSISQELLYHQTT